MTGQAQPAAPEALAPLLVDAREAARLCGVSRSTWLSLKAQGRVPRSVRLGRRRLWNVAELKRWTAAGCPPRERWEGMQDCRDLHGAGQGAAT